MPMGPGTYGNKKGRPKKKSTKILTDKQKKLPVNLQKIIIKKKTKNKK